MCAREDSQEVGLEAATLQRVRNSSLVEWARADNAAGLSSAPKPRMDPPAGGSVVGERPAAGEGRPGGRLEAAGVRMPARVAQSEWEAQTPHGRGFLREVHPRRVSRA